VNAYQLALDQARTELAEAQRQQRLLNMRVSQLEALVTQLNSFIGRGATQSAPLFEASMPTTVVIPTLSAAPESEPQSAEVPIWKALMSALTDREKADFTVPQALEALTRTGRVIASRNRLNIIRNIVIGKDHIFGRLETGHYFVRGYEKEDEEKEVPSKEKTS
jgi:hypothetical protein